MSFSEVLLLIVIPVVAVLCVVWGIYETRNLPSLDEQERANAEALGSVYDHRHDPQGDELEQIQVEQEAIDFPHGYSEEEEYRLVAAEDTEPPVSAEAKALLSDALEHWMQHLEEHLSTELYDDAEQYAQEIERKILK